MQRDRNDRNDRNVRRATAYAAASLALALVLVLAGACTPQAEERAERSAAETERELEATGREVGGELERAGDVVEREAEELGRQLEPYARDAEITTAIKAKLVADPEVNPLHVDVDTVDGRVTLNGEVASESQRAEAEKLARQTDGVIEVVNLLEVGPRGG